ARPRLAAFWRSGLSFPNMAGNLKGVRELFVGSGFAAIVAGESPGVEDSILFDLDRVIRILEAENTPIAEAVQEPAQRNKLEALRVALKSARDTASSLIAQGAGLSFGFNAMDGD
ncbi:imelysin family protein, partial [Methyloceanibacter marginalis]|uniref:imelysin family protein n=1 Tax=Methyloceanibacter marginalis TaxID=1774971 RepID=UPI00244E9530